MTDMTVANTILAQLGGNKFRVMTGAKNLIGSADGLSMKVAGRIAKGRVSYVTVKLDPTDTYIVKSFSVYKHKLTELYSADMVYDDMLAKTFTEATGLETRLF
jgi:hypothetical protein